MWHRMGVCGVLGQQLTAFVASVANHPDRPLLKESDDESRRTLLCSPSFSRCLFLCGILALHEDEDVTPRPLTV